MRWPYICVPAASGLELLRTSDVVGLCTPGNLADTASKYTEPLMSEQSITELRTPGSSSHILMRSPDGARLCAPGARVLTLAAGGGVLPLLAAAAGAASVIAVERSRMLYRMARQVWSQALAALQLLLARARARRLPLPKVLLNMQISHTT